MLVDKGSHSTRFKTEQVGKREVDGSRGQAGRVLTEYSKFGESERGGVDSSEDQHESIRARGESLLQNLKVRPRREPERK